MTILTDVALFAVPFVLALAAFSYVFERFMGANEDTFYFAQVMREINAGEPPATASTAAPAKVKAAGAA